MRACRPKHLSDPELLRAYDEVNARDRTTTAEMLEYTAEVDRRRLYLPAGYPSMLAFCVERMGMSDDAAFMRIRAARAARRFPVIYDHVAQGRLHLSAVLLLAPHLTSENFQDLAEAASHRTKSGIREMLARRFPRPDLPARVHALHMPSEQAELGPDPVEPGSRLVGEDAGAPRLMTDSCGPNPIANSGNQLGPDPVEARFPKLEPLAPERYALQVTIAGTTHAKLRHAQALLSHKLPSGDLARVLDLALDALVEKLEKRKFAETATPRPQRRRKANPNPRRIPAHVRRAVWRRDGGRCTFVGDHGRRCSAVKFLEFDHVETVAHGGVATPGNLRLRCRAHNQMEAERVFGAGFMETKRRLARRATRSAPRKRPAAGSGPRASNGAAADTTARDQAADVMAALRTLGVRADRARRATGISMATPCATLEERVRMALRVLGPKPRARGVMTASP